jgi:hypothetical protein
MWNGENHQGRQENAFTSIPVLAAAVVVSADRICHKRQESGGSF